MDPSVWAVQDKSILHDRNHAQNNFSLYPNPESFLRQHFSQPFSNTTQNSHTISALPLSAVESASRLLTPGPQASGPPKMLSLEDIERNILNQQQQKKSMQENKPPIENHLANLKQQLSNVKVMQIQPPMMPNQRPQMFMPQHPAHPLMNFPNSGPRLPPGFPPAHHHLAHQMGGGSVNSGPPPQQLQPPAHLGPRNMPPNLPMHHNNFNMHPAFNMMRPPMPPLGPPPQRIPNIGPPPLLQQQQNFQQNVQNSAQFNKRLVQEIQQNHPLLSYNRNGMNNNYNHHNNHNNIYPNNNGNQHHNNNNNNNMNGQKQHNNRSNGNLVSSAKTLIRLIYLFFRFIFIHRI